MERSARFPELAGTSLAGRRFRLPGDFDGNPTLALVAFQRRQQSAVDTWIPLASELGERFPELRSYELPVISRGYRPVRKLIDGGMRGGLPDPSVRAATITVYTDKSVFLTALGLTTDDEIQALLVEPDGWISWRTAGPLTSGAASELCAAVGRGG
jgi:hypothetical protein